MSDIALQAFDGSPIPNAVGSGPTAEAVENDQRHVSAELAQAEDLGPPTGRFNCHGLTFGSRRAQIPGAEIDYRIWTLLQADEYARVDDGPKVGDVVIWVNDNTGNIDHSGIVVEITDITVMVRSAWGSLGEKRHPVHVSPYRDDCSIQYWRLDL